MQQKDFKYLFFFTIISLGFFIIAPSNVFAGSVIKPFNNLGLVGYWSFEDTHNTVATDFSGNGFDGTLVDMDAGTDYVAGYKSGSTALDFDGTNDEVQLPSAVSAIADIRDKTDTISVCLWAKPDNASPSTWSVLYGNSQTGQDAGLVYGGYVAMTFYGAGSQGLNIVGSVPTDEWSNFCFTQNGSNQLVKVYLNGVYKDSITRTVDVTNSNPLVIGGETTNLNRHFDGKIDDVRVFSRLLSDEEIYQLYRNDGGQTVVAQSSHANLVGYWSFEDATGTQVTDFSGNGNTGTLTNMANDDWVNGRVGKALDFDGVDDYVDVGTIGNINNADKAFSVSSWIYLNDYGDYNIIVNGSGEASSANKFNTYFAVSAYYSNSMYFTVGKAQAGGPTVYTNSSPPLGRWVHVAVTWAGGSSDASGIKIYFDGVSQSLTVLDNTFNGTGSNLNDWVIGSFAGPDRGLYPFDGQLDEVRIYDTALTQTQIQNLYNNSKSTKVNSSQNSKLTDGLVGLWSFNGSDIDWANNRAIDGSGNGNDGVLTSFSSVTAPTFGVNGQALYFNNSPTIAIPSSADFAYGTGDFTWSVWVNPTALSGNDYIIDHGSNGGVLRAYTSNYEYYTATSGNQSASYAPVVGQWDMFTAVRRSGTVYLYINGVEKISFADATNFGTQSVTIGNFGGGGPYAWDGKADEVRLYNRALTASEITRLYNMGN